MPSVPVAYGDYRGSAYIPISADRYIVAADNNLDIVLAPARTGRTIFVRRVLISVTSDTALIGIRVADDAGAPSVVAVIIAAAPVGPYEWDFGDEGIALAEGQALKLITTGTGGAAAVHVEGYYRQTAVLTPEQLKTS